jgi:hypothetical protein
MSGLLMRLIKTLAKMVSATRVPNTVTASWWAGGAGGFSLVEDRLITPSARCLASSGIGSARLQ